MSLNLLIMLRVITVTSILLLLSPFCSQAQLALKGPNRIPKNLPISMGNVITPLDIYNNPMENETPVKGTPYMSEQYAKAKFQTSFGEFTDVLARYNIYYDQIEFKEGDSVFAIRPDQVIQRVEIDNKTFVVDSYEFRGDIIPGYFQLVEAGKLKLLTKMVITLRERQEPKPLQTEGSPARFDRMPDVYYYRIGDMPTIKLKSIQKMIDTLPDHKKEMEQFVKKEKLSAKDQDELARLVRYYNSLK